MRRRPTTEIGTDGVEAARRLQPSDVGDVVDAKDLPGHERVEYKGRWPRARRGNINEPAQASASQRIRGGEGRGRGEEGVGLDDGDRLHGMAVREERAELGTKRGWITTNPSD